MATIYDVARAAGVSPKTVSRVLNGDAPVGQKTRDAVHAAMNQLGYVPSHAARMMRSNRSGLIGLITGAISNPRAEIGRNAGLPDLLIVHGVQQILGHSPLTLMIADTAGRADRVPALIDTLVSHRVEGLIYVAEFHQQVELPPVPETTPLVLANCFDQKGTPAIIPDDRRGMHQLVQRIIQAGHRRIAYLTLFPQIIATGLRMQGYCDALEEAGIAFDRTLVEPCEMDSPEAETQLLWDAIDRMLRLPDPPTVFCCGNDKMALKVYGILRSRGVRVPDDMSVAGYDNHKMIAETLYPPLTTAELPYSAMGARAAQQLISLIAGEPRPDTGPSLVAGPVLWRGSVESRPSQSKILKLVKED